MSRQRIGWVLAVVVTLAVAAYFVPAAADWLVTKEGDRVKTDGPWKVDNRLVVFKRPDGTYASIRVSDVDLEASERLTEEMAAAERAPKAADTQEEEPARRKSVMRLTDRDLPPVGRGRGASDETSSGGASDERSSGGGAADAAGQDRGELRPLEVVSWRESETSGTGGIEFVGRVRNRSQRTALGVTVLVTLFDPEGEEITDTQAQITAQSLPPGGTAGFRASFPSVFSYARAEFGVTGDLVLNEP